MSPTLPRKFECIDTGDTPLIHYFYMPTIKRRINVTLSKTIDTVLTRAARRDGVPTATKAAELLQLALEIEEDLAWDKRASVRDTAHARFVSHRVAWK